MTTMNYSDILKEIYYNPENPGSFGSVNKLYERAKLKNHNITLEDVKNWLSGELTYTLHKQARQNWKREKILVSAPCEQYQADLVDMQSFSRQNKGFRYILTIIDCFTRYAYAIPVKSKNKNDVKQAFQKVFDDLPPCKLQTDRGTEFLNDIVQSYLESKGIHYFNTYNTKFKCAIVERFNRTLKSRMYKYFTANGTRKYIDVLPKLVDSYNRSFHRSIGTTPINVNDNNKLDVFRNIYKFPDEETYRAQKISKPKLLEGQEVRRKYELNPFDKGFYPTWTDVIYRIAKSIKGKEKAMYKLLDEHGNELKQRFYPEEIQKVKSDLFRIEKIIKREKRNGRDGFIVKWLGYSTEHNSWIPKEAVQNVGGIS